MAAEDVEGLAFDLGLAAVDSAHMTVAHSLIWSTSELHTLSSADGRPPLATGPWVAAWVAGRFARSSAAATLRRAGVELRELLEMDVSYHGAVYGDDEVRARCSVTSCSELNGDRRLVLEDRCFDAHDRPLLTSVRAHRWTPVVPVSTE